MRKRARKASRVGLCIHKASKCQETSTITAYKNYNGNSLQELQNRLFEVHHSCLSHQAASLLKKADAEAKIEE
jgi:hypothetical protein